MLIDEIVDFCDTKYRNSKCNRCDNCSYGDNCPGSCERCLHYIHTPTSAPAPMLMCHKVTHKKLIDNSPLFRKNFKVEFHGSHTNCVASFA